MTLTRSDAFGGLVWSTPGPHEDRGRGFGDVRRAVGASVALDASNARPSPSSPAFLEVREKLDESIDLRRISQLRLVPADQVRLSFGCRLLLLPSSLLKRGLCDGRDVANHAQEEHDPHRTADDERNDQRYPKRQGVRKGHVGERCQASDDEDHGDQQWPYESGPSVPCQRVDVGKLVSSESGRRCEYVSSVSAADACPSRA
jgi:hypothetical protein